MTNQSETEDFKNLVEDVISKAIDKASQFTHATHCCGSYEMLSVTFENLRALYEISKENSLPFRYQAIPLVHLYGVAKSLRESNIFLDHDKVLYRYHHLPIDNFSGNIFPVDWKKPWTMQMTILKETVEFKNLVEGVIRETICSNSHLTDEEIAKVVMTVVGGSQRLSGELKWKVSLRFGSNPFWRSCIESFGKTGFNFMNVSSVKRFHESLKLVYYADCVGKPNYISLDCSIYLVEYLLTMIFYLKGRFFSAKSCFLEWLISREWNKNSILKFEADWQEQFSCALDIIAGMVAELLYNEKDVFTWMKNSKLESEAHPILVSRLFVALCSLCVNSGKYYDLLFELLDRAEIISKLPP
ncbi:hypothetical protein TIFTF001_030762 [Ficus carica]|uniref:Uncharacterized protein n=1 Tax=Ficus carica TaxID=3494 RepID=A0AA88DUU3_FICCA|nr:hypothetical protein TIFTF001_030762 [Ficus carica]